MSTPIKTPPAKLIIAVSSRSLFHMEDGNAIFEKKGQEEFDKYMLQTMDKPLRPGTAFPLVRKLLNLNKYTEHPVVDVIILSRNSTAAGLRVQRSVKSYNLNISKAAFTKGGDRYNYAKSFGAHLFLSANESDVRKSLQAGIASAMLNTKEVQDPDDHTVRIAFDGDSVLFNDEADNVYRSLGLDAFREHETKHAARPLEEGPLAKFLFALRDVQKELDLSKSAKPEDLLRLALVTARGFESLERPIHTLLKWGVGIDDTVWAAGSAKGPLLEAFNPDMFFDDTKSNIASALLHGVSSGHVPNGDGGITHN